MDWLEEPLFRPPAEAESLIFQVSRGCPHNACRFCGMYKGVRYCERPLRDIFGDIDRASESGWRSVRRIFLADGDALMRKTEDLLQIDVSAVWCTLPDSGISE